MVKKTCYFAVGAVCFFLLGLAVSCSKAAHPVVPAGAAVLDLQVPSFVLNSRHAKHARTASPRDPVPDSEEGALEYYLVADGEAPVTGVVVFYSGSDVGDIFIPLPKAGPWVVSAEWWYVYNEEEGDLAGAKKHHSKLTLPNDLVADYPEFVGADMVNVQGTTAFTLNMEDIDYDEYECYTGNLADSTNCDFNLDGEGIDIDLFSFNSDVFSDSITLGTTGDMQALFDATSQSTYLSAQTVVTLPDPPPPSIFTYLGNGDLCDFPVLPTNPTYYPNTLQARAAVAGSAAATLQVGDVYVVKVLSTNALAWLQITSDNVTCPATNNSSAINFCFVYQDEGLNYMKFDQTTYGLANCNLNTPAPAPSAVHR
jgi:hypothetical protein